MGSANTPNKRFEPVSGYQFQVYVSNIRMGFSKVTNIEESIETRAFQEGGVNDRVYSLYSPVTAERTLVFERGLGNSSQMSDLLNPRTSVGRRVLPDILIVVGARNGSVSNIYHELGQRMPPAWFAAKAAAYFHTSMEQLFTEGGKQNE